MKVYRSNFKKDDLKILPSVNGKHITCFEFESCLPDLFEVSCQQFSNIPNKFEYSLPPINIITVSVKHIYLATIYLIPVALVSERQKRRSVELQSNP